MDKKTGKKMVEKNGKPVKPRCAKEREVVFAKLQLATPICIESFDQFPQLGRFTLGMKVSGRLELRFKVTVCCRCLLWFRFILQLTQTTLSKTGIVHF